MNGTVPERFEPTEVDKSLAMYLVKNSLEMYQMKDAESPSLLFQCHLAVRWFAQQTEILGITDTLVGDYDDGYIDAELFEKIKTLLLI